MIIGVPKEVKADERRVSITPDKIKGLIESGHKIVFERGAGEKAGFPDSDYPCAEIVSNAQKVWESADLVVKVKEPQQEEFKHFRQNQIIFTYLHLAAAPELTLELVKTKVIGIAYETIQTKNGSLPLLEPMSEIAGRLAPQIAARLLQSDFDGPGKLLGGVPGVEPCRFMIIGGGTVGLNAAIIATSLGSRVTIFDINLERLRAIEYRYRGSIKTMLSTETKLMEFLKRTDVVVGAVLIPGASAPKVISENMVNIMNPSSLILDVAIDQGGSVENIKPTTQSNPTYIKNNVIHCAIPNIPGSVANTASTALSNATYKYILYLANNGIENLITRNETFAMGINTLNGHVTHKALAESLDLQHVDVIEAL
ncbi:MAG: alanine dehydrogenase [Chloroflexi bacterium]|jgi:alanine dehydrogenase|nr:MAG: alanine dehydrogenase [Chloroflexota bacterium]